MKRILLLAITLAIIVGAFVFMQQMKQGEDLPANQQLLGQLSAQADALVSVQIDNIQGTLMHATLGDGKWQATHLANGLRFPVEQSELRDFVGHLARAKVVELKTANSANYSRLGVEDLSTENASGHLITLQTGGEQWSVILGNQSSSSGGRFVRLANDKQTYLIDQTITLPASKSSWLQNPVVTFDVDEIDSISLTGARNWQLIRSDENTWNLADLSASENLAYEGVLDTTVRAFSEIEFEDLMVRQATQLSWFTSAPQVIASIKTENDEWIVNIYENDEIGQVWFTFDNAGNPWQTQWAYKLSTFDADGLLRERSDFILQDEPESTATP